MSILFPKVNQPRQWDFRPRYYDAEKERHKQRIAESEKRVEAKMRAESEMGESGISDDSAAEYHTRLHRGSFREARKNVAYGAQRKSRLAFWVALLLMLLFCFYVLF